MRMKVMDHGGGGGVRAHSLQGRKANTGTSCSRTTVHGDDPKYKTRAFWNLGVGFVKGRKLDHRGRLGSGHVRPGIESGTQRQEAAFPTTTRYPLPDRACLARA